MTEVQGNHRASRQVLLASLWLTLLVLAVKVWVGWVTQSLSLVSEALHTLIDGFSILFSVIALSSAGAAGNRETWGHGKLEVILAFLLAGFLGFGCLSLLANAGQQLLTIALTVHAPPFVQINSSMLQLVGVLVATSFCMACFERYLAGILKSSLLTFASGRLFLDVWLLLVVLAGLGGSSSGIAWLDPLLAVVMILSAIASCCRAFNRQLPLLMKQVAIAPEALAQTIHQVEGITHCYGIRSRGLVGRHVFVEMRLILHPECMSIARTIAERVERVIRERYGPVRVVIHIDDIANAGEWQRLNPTYLDEIRYRNG